MNTKFLTFASALVLAGCGHVENANLSDRQLLKVKPLSEDHGVVLAETKVAGPTNAKEITQNPSDCMDASGMGIQVDMTTGSKRYLFDKEGDPCKAAETLFDGKYKVYNRAADPAINIAFKDKYGNLPEKDILLNTEALDVLMPSTPTAATPEEAAVSGFNGTETYKVELAPGVKPGNDGTYKMSERFEPTQLMPNGAQVGHVTDSQLSHTINAWKEDQQHAEILKEAETLLAGVRDLSRKSSDELLKEHQNQIKALLVQLRGAERVIEYQREKERRLRQEIEQGDRTLHAERIDRQQYERTVGNQIAQHENRANEYQNIAHSIKVKHMETVRQHKQDMELMRKDLSKAEVGASQVRQKMILEAAKKIAEAEAIASAARLDKREAMEREANRLSVDAEHVLRRAMQIDAGEKITVPAFDSLKKFEVPAEQYKKRIMQLEERLAALETPETMSDAVEGNAQASHPMENATVILKAENETLKDIFNGTLKQLEDRIGPWKVEWRLSKQYASISNEKWTVIAEAKFEEFLAYVQEKVRQEHGASLTFRRFDNSGLFVISNE